MRYKRCFKLTILGFITPFLLFGILPVSAASANISHSYKSTTSIPNGSLVSLDATQQSYVDLSNTSNESKLLGVAVEAKDSLLAVDASSSTVQVATDGQATALVSNVNGDIDVGDEVSVSPFNGIGMKGSQGTVAIGLAQTVFNGTGNNVTTEQVKNKSGKLTDIKVGYVTVSISVTSIASTTGQDHLSALQKLAKSITGQDVSNFRVAVGLVVAAVALLSLVTLIYTSVYASIVSVGRNPLAKFAVFRTLRSVLLMALFTTAIAVLTIYLLLR